MLLNSIVSHTDIDECLQQPCDQVCNDTDGGFECSCNDGYELAMDEAKCNGMEILIGHDIVNSLTSLDLQDQVMLHNLVPMHI